MAFFWIWFCNILHTYCISYFLLLASTDPIQFINLAAHIMDALGFSGQPCHTQELYEINTVIFGP